MTHTNGTWRAGSMALATLAILGGCTTEPEALDEALLDDVALLAADAVLEDVTLWGQPLGPTPPATTTQSEPLLMPGHPGGQGGWTGTFSGTRSVTYFDAEGNVQTGYHPVTTASIHFLHEIEGSVSRSGWSATVHRERDKTVSGLAGAETHRTWNGTGSEEISRSRHLDDGTERSYEASGTVEYDDVVVPIPGSDPRWPVSGTIRRMMTITRTGPDGSETRTVEIVITFNGTSTATMTVNGEQMEIDLSARSGMNPVRHTRR